MLDSRFPGFIHIFGTVSQETSFEPTSDIKIIPVLAPELLSRLELISVKVPLLMVKLVVFKPSSRQLKGGAATTARSTSAPLLHHVSSSIAPKALTLPDMCVPN